MGSIPGSGTSHGGGPGNPLQHSCLGNPVDRGAWWATVQSTSVQFCGPVVSDSLRPHGLQHTRPPCPSPTPRVYSKSPIESVMPSNHLILCRPLLLLPSVFPSIRVFSNESALHIRWPEYWSFSFGISPSSEHSGYSPHGCKESEMTEAA